MKGNIKKMKEKCVLVVSTGTQDLKVVCQDKKNRAVVLRSIDRKGGYHLRKFHRRLLNRDIGYKLVSSENDIKSECPSTELAEFDLAPDDNKFIKLSKDGGNFDDQFVEALVNKNGEYLLFPAKLYTVVAGLKERYDINAVLVCYTDRIKHDKNFEEDYNNEPIATGKLIAEWLAGGKGLNPREGADFKNHPFCYLNYLKDEVALEGKRVALDHQFSPYDQPLALSAIAHIDSAVKALADKHGHCTAVVSHTGGPGDVKAPLTASARLHFGGRIIEIHDNKYAPFKSRYLSVVTYSIPPRNTALDMRHQAALRLWEGDFAGAWAVASYIEKNDPDYPCDRWIDKVREAANFIQGWQRHNENDINPFKTVPKGMRKLVLLAWRVEAALQNNQGNPLIADALRNLFTFSEKYFEYLILMKLKKDGEFEGEVDLDAWIVTDTTPSSLPGGLELDRDGFINLKGDNQKSNAGNYLHNSRGYMPKSTLAFKIYKKILGEEFDKPLSLREYRNRLTHNVLDANEIDSIKRFALRKNLWKLDGNKQDSKLLGQCFLGRSKVDALFRSISAEIDCANLYREFVKGLLDEIKSPITTDCVG